MYMRGPKESDIVLELLSCKDHVQHFDVYAFRENSCLYILFRPLKIFVYTFYLLGVTLNRVIYLNLLSEKENPWIMQDDYMMKFLHK